MPTIARTIIAQSGRRNPVIYSLDNKGNIIDKRVVSLSKVRSKAAKKKARSR